MKYNLANSSWTQNEINAINRVIKSNRFTMGLEVEKFEEEFSNFIGSRYAIMVNSGSTANLLSIASLIYCKHYDLKPGDEVIVPAVSWGTTFFPLHQYGLVPVFVDIDKYTLNIDVKEIEKAITPKTKAIFTVNLLGNPCNFLEIQKLCKKHNIILIEDNCESFGAKYNNRYTGTFGVLGTFSFFFSHHLQTMEGGMIVTDDEELMQFIKSLRAHGWLRDLPDKNWLYNKSGNTFEDSFKFIVPGYSVRPLELSGAIGREQLKKAKLFLLNRKNNAKIFQKEMENISTFFTPQKEVGSSSWFGFSILIDQMSNILRDDVIKVLSNCSIETRPIVAGNFITNPVIKYINHRVVGNLYNSNYIHNQGFFIGNDNQNISEKILHATNTLKGLLS